MRTEVFCAFLAFLVCCEANYGTNFGANYGFGGLGYGAAGLGYGAAGYNLPVAERVVVQAPAALPATLPAAAASSLPLRSSYDVGAYTIVLDNGATYVVAADPSYSAGLYSGAMRYGYGSQAARYGYYLKK